MCECTRAPLVNEGSLSRTAKREGTSQAGTSSKKLKGKTRDKVKVKKADVEDYGIKTPTVPDEDTVDEVPNSQMDSSFVSVYSSR